MVNIDWSKLATLEYWLQGIAGETVGAPFVEVGSFFYWFYLYFFATLIIVGIMAKVSRAFIHMDHPIQKLIPFWSNSVIWLGFVGLFWFLMRELNIGLLGARLWLFPMFFYVLVVGFLSARHMRNYYFIELAYFKTLHPSNKVKKTDATSKSITS